MIKKVGSKYELRSKDGKKKLGTFDTKAEAETREHEIQGFSDKSMVNVSLSITKASVLQDGTMRFQATCSDIDEDSRGEQTTLSLFTDWSERIDKSESVNWLPKPEMPFLGIAHYPALDGKGEAAVIEKVYTDGKQFKVSGQFYNNNTDFPCGLVAFNAILAEKALIQKGGSIENPLQISAAWWDLEHSHGDFIFTRKSADDKCSMCSEGQPRKFLKGHLDHMAITRHPVHPRTSIGLEKMSDGEAITRQQDAASIVGDELAEMLDKLTRPTEKSGPALETLSEESTIEPDVKKFHLGGATSFEEAEAFVVAQEIENRVWSNFDMFMEIIDGIKFSNNPDLDKISAIEQTITDFGERISNLQSVTVDSLMLSEAQIGGVQMSDEKEVQEDVVIHPVDGFKQTYETVLADDDLDRTAKLAAFQKGINKLADSIKSKVDIAAPQSMADQLSQAMEPILQELKLLNTKSGQQVQSGQPTQRSLSPGQQIVNPGQPVQQSQEKEPTYFEKVAAQTTLAR